MNPLLTLTLLPGSDHTMIATLIRSSIQNRFLILLFLLLILLWGTRSMMETPIDALPDLSDAQVIVYSEYEGQSARIVEDQVTYPLTTSLVSVPGARVVRGYSFFGYSLVYVIFEDGTDLYWARSRVLEYLNYAQKRLPEKVVSTLGPDATGVGWVFEYALVSKNHSLAELRSLQDWYLKYELSGVAGVSEVASIGGYVKQYQVNVDPAKLRFYNIGIQMVEMAIKNGNADAGGEVIEMGEMEFMIRGLGYLKNLKDIENIPLMMNPLTGSYVSVKDVAHVTAGPEMRRGLSDLNGEGEVAGGIVIVRFGENALKVIQAVKNKLEILKQGLPSGVEIIPVYDRAGLIRKAIVHLREKLIEEILMVGVICFLFLFHVRSAFVAVFTLPTAILISFMIMNAQGINANIMSLGGIAIAIGAMVDAAIIMIENAHKHLEQEAHKPPSEKRNHWQIILDSSVEVGPSLFWSLLVITVSFLPVFSLEAQEGRLFKPLAYTKTYAMAAAAFLAVTLIPVLMGYFIKGTPRSESENPLNRWIISLYHPLAEFSLRHPWFMILTALFCVLMTFFPFSRLGSEFMPPMYEGDLLYMPTTLPGISVTKSRELLQQTDRIIKTFPEVKQVFGKAGRADTATDPAGLDMLETTIELKPQTQWRKGMTPEKLVEELDRAIQIPGLTNAWTMPIKARTDMLSTGIRTPVGIKISGPDLDTLEKIGKEVEETIRRVPGTSSAFAERVMGGNYLDIRINRVEAARHGLNISDVQSVIQTAIGGMNITRTVEGLERYPVNLRYSRELRDNMQDIQKVLLTAPNGELIPLGHVAEISLSKGPMVVRSENTRPNLWVFVDVRSRDIGSYIKEAQPFLQSRIKLPSGYNLVWSGEFEYMERAKKKLQVVIPATVLIIFMILYLNTKSLIKTSIVLLAVPFSLVGAVWFLYLLEYHLSLAVWIGMIALAGLDAETGVVMLLYLEQAYDALQKKGKLNSLSDLKTAIHEGAVKRVRPKIMTASVIVGGLLPILWSQGAGADVMKRIAAPMVGGVLSSVLLELLIYPSIYYLWKKREIKTLP